MMFRTLALIAVFCLANVEAAAAENGMVERGRNIAVRLCAQCHAIGTAEGSPHATAPAFRRLDPRVDLDELAQRLQEGILAGHPEMPVFVLRPDEARATVAYIKSIRADR